MIFRKNRPTSTYRPSARPPEPPRVEYVGITLAEMQELERILLHADECTRRSRPDLGHNTSTTDLIGRLYRSAGAASVTQPDPDLVRIPLQVCDFLWLEHAIRDIEMYRGSAQTGRDGRTLLNRFNALLGRARAVVHMGGTPVFAPDAPAVGPGLPARPDGGRR